MNSQPLIAPHEGIEFALMESGQKSVALFTDFIPADFVPHLHRRYRIKTLFVAQKDGFAFPSFIIYLPESEAQAQRLECLLTPERLALPETHREIGRILGYSEQQIDAFI